MRFAIAYHDFLGVIGELSTIASGGVFPFAHLLIQVEDAVVRIHSLDQNQRGYAKLPAASTESGSAIVHASRFCEVVRAIGAGTVEFRFFHDRFIAHCGSRSFGGMAQPGERFPSIPSSLSGPLFLTSSAPLRRLLRQTQHAMCAGTPVHLCGIHLTLNHGSLRAEATDGRRVVRAEATTSLQGAFDFILPRRSVRRLLSIASSLEMIELAFIDHLLIARGDLTTFGVSGLHDDIAFPILDSFINDRAESEISASRSDFISLLKFIIVMKTEEEGHERTERRILCPIEMEIKSDGGLTVRSSGNDGEVATDSLQISSTGKCAGQSYRVDAIGVLDALTAMDSEYVRIGFIDNRIIFREDGFVAMVMMDR